MRAVWQPESVTRRMNEISSTALLWGFDAIEIRSVGGPEDRVPHVSERLIRSSCMEADLVVAALDPEFFGGPAAEKSTWMNELAMLPEVIRLAGRLAGRVGKPGIILGSLEHGDGDDESATAAALETIFGEAGRLAGREGLAVHIRTGSSRQTSVVRDVLLSTGSNVLRPMPEIGIAGSHDTVDTGAETHIPDETRDATYVRLVYRGPQTVSLEDADGLRDQFQAVIQRLRTFDSVADVCLEFERRPDPVAGLRVSTAFVSALNGA